MRQRNLLLTILVAVVLIVLLTPYASPQPTPSVTINEVQAPPTIGVRQSLKVNVTVAYAYSWEEGERLLIAILNLTNHPLRTTAMPTDCYFPSAESMCIVNPPGANNTVNCCQGIFTASFALTSPNQTEAWYLDADAGITKLNPFLSGYSIVATSSQPLAIYVRPTPLPEASPITLLSISLLASACLKRKKSTARIRNSRNRSQRSLPGRTTSIASIPAATDF